MKSLLFAGALFGALLIVGCGSGADNRVQAPATDVVPTDAGKAAAKQGMDNASITQQVMKNHRLPNGQPLPGAPAGGG